MDSKNKNSAADEEPRRIETLINTIDKAIQRAYRNWAMFRIGLYSKRRQLRKRWFDVQHMGLLLGILAIVIMIGGALVQYGRNLSARQMIVDLWANTGTELLSIAITVLIIDALNRRRDYRKEVQQKKDQLFLEAKSQIPGVVHRALEEMRQYGWLSSPDQLLAGTVLDGVNFEGQELSWANLEKTSLIEANLKHTNLRWANLNGAKLKRANLQGADLLDSQLITADLVKANLQGVDLRMANLLGADIRHANLSGARLYQANLQGAELVETNFEGASISNSQFLYACSMKEAIMPDGLRYDGRFSLEGDLIFAAQFNGLDLDNPKDMASWYLVSIEQYLEGQSWFKKNQDKLLGDWERVVERHHGPKKELEGLCEPSEMIKEVLGRPLRPEAKVKEIRVLVDEVLPHIVDENTSM